MQKPFYCAVARLALAMLIYGSMHRCLAQTALDPSGVASTARLTPAEALLDRPLTAQSVPRSLAQLPTNPSPFIERLPTVFNARQQYAPVASPIVQTAAHAIDEPSEAGASGPDDLVRRMEAAENGLNDLRSQQTSSSSLGDRLKGLEDFFKQDKNKMPLVRLSGFFHFDTGFFSQDPNSRATLGDIQNGSGFRRARLQGLGNVTEFTKFSIEMDFGSAGAGRPSFQDVWGEQSNLPYVGAVRIGQFRQPITMDSWTNIRHLEFLERPLPFQAFDPFRRVGVMGYRIADDELSMVAASVFGTGFTFFNGSNTTYNTLGVDNRFGTQIGDNGGVSFAVRATHLLYYDELAEGRYLLHIGGGYDFSEIGGSGTTGSFARTYEARSIPEFFVGDSAAGGLTSGGTPFFVDTGRFLATSYNFYHLELAGNYGPAHFQAEYMATGVNQFGGPVVFYDGAYLQGGYFLTGESCGYNKQAGVMDYNVTPFANFFGLKSGMCGWGAWEIAARWSWLDLSARNINPANQVGFSTAGPPPSPNPGMLNESTVALNWYWNSYTRVQFNWIHAMLDNNQRGFSATDIYTLRYQIEF